MPDTEEAPRTRTARERPDTTSDVRHTKGEDASMADDKGPSPMEVLREARAQLAELTGRDAETVSSFERTEDGWTLDIEVLELARVPDTMSLMASYRVDLDPQGRLTGYRRVSRYERGRSDAHRGGGR